MNSEGTHSLIVSGAGGTAAGDTTVGQITLPANGPYIVHNVFGTVVQATQTAGESLLCSGVIRSVSGDVQPNPSPCLFPIQESGSLLGATAPQPVCQTALFPVNWTAAGKAVMDLILRQHTGNAVAPQAVLGVMFGKMRPSGEPPRNIDGVRAAVTATAETAVGTITLATNAKKIVGILPTMLQDNVLTANEELIGWVRLASDDVDLAPSMWPMLAGFGGGLGALVGGASGIYPRYWPVDIPVPGGARINVTVDLNTAVTNAAEVQCYVLYL